MVNVPFSASTLATLPLIPPLTLGEVWAFADANPIALIAIPHNKVPTVLLDIIRFLSKVSSFCSEADCGKPLCHSFGWAYPGLKAV
jgi:hypothetical protein